MSRRQQRRSPMSSHRGVTIIEVILVSVIAVVLATFAIVKYTPTTVNIVAEADRVRNDLRLMQMAAMNWGTPLRFTPASGGYSFSCPQAVANTPCSTGTLSASAANLAGLNTVAFDAQFEPNITLSGSTLDYDSLGRPASSCNTTCALLSTAYTANLTGPGATQTITVDPISGFPR